MSFSVSETHNFPSLILSGLCDSTKACPRPVVRRASVAVSGTVPIWQFLGFRLIETRTSNLRVFTQFPVWNNDQAQTPSSHPRSTADYTRQSAGQGDTSQAIDVGVSSLGKLFESLAENPAGQRRRSDTPDVAVTPPFHQP